MAPRLMPKDTGVFRNSEYIKLLDNARTILEKYISTASPNDSNTKAAKRAVRALMSQDDLQFLKVLQKNADNLDPVSLAKKVVTAENSIRKKYSPSPGVEMHHVNSISSWYEKIKNMPTKEAMQANHYVQSKGHILGTDKRLLPITRDIHQGGWDMPTAHSDIIKSAQADRWVVDQGAWKTDRPAAFDADPFQVGDEFIDEIANIQGRLSFHAYTDPLEVKARNALRIKTGHHSYSKTENNPQLRSIQKAEQKAMGLNLGDIRRQLMPTNVSRNPLVQGAKTISRAIPGPVDAVLPAFVAGGVALASGATLPQAAQAAQTGAVEGLTGDLQGTPEPAVTMVNVGGKLRPLNTDTNTLMDKPGYGLEQKGGQWREVERGTGAATQQQRQDIQQTVQQASKLIPTVNKAINPVAAKITNELTWLQRQAQKAINDAWMRTIRKEGDV